ncbi:MAG: hypothetical protein WD771_09475 [Gemmatimonadaceae bacterium]
MRRLLVASLALAVLAIPARAQNCAADGITEDACVKARDLFLYMAPQLGTAISGGSHTLGVGTTLGGFPHFAIALRANAVMGDLPTIDNVTVGAATVSTIESEANPVPMVTADFALGVFKGVSLGVTRVGGVDLIGGVTFVPKVEDDNTSLVPQSSTSIGLGARIGLLEQSAVVPGVSFSFMKRNLPVLDFGFATDGGDQFNIDDFTVNTTSWRLSAQKNLLLFQLGAGIGGDKYDFSTTATGDVDGATFGFGAKESMSRTTMYGTLGLNLFLFKAVAEVGQVSGGDLVTYNDFTEPADKNRLYATVGLRISF